MDDVICVRLWQRRELQHTANQASFDKPQCIGAGHQGQTSMLMVQTPLSGALKVADSVSRILYTKI